MEKGKGFTFIKPRMMIGDNHRASVYARSALKVKGKLTRSDAFTGGGLTPKIKSTAPRDPPPLPNLVKKKAKGMGLKILPR